MSVNLRGAMSTPYPSFHQIIARTRLKAVGFPLQGVSTIVMSVAVGLTIVTLLISGVALIHEGWRPVLRLVALWIYLGSIFGFGLWLLLFLLGAFISLLSASQIGARQFDQRHALEQDLADHVARDYTRDMIARTLRRLQLEIDLTENHKAMVAAGGAVLGSLVPLAANLPENPLKVQVDDTLKLAIATAGIGGALALMFIMRFKTHMGRAKHVLQEAEQRLGAAAGPDAG
jgi:hypothetical protein